MPKGKLTDRQRAELQSFFAAIADWNAPGGVWGGKFIDSQLKADLLVGEKLAALGQPAKLRAAFETGRGDVLGRAVFLLRQTAQDAAQKTTRWLRKWGGQEPPPNRPFKGI